MKDITMQEKWVLDILRAKDNGVFSIYKQKGKIIRVKTEDNLFPNISTTGNGVTSVNDML